MTPTTTITIMIAMIPGTMYMSAMDAGIGVGSGVGSGAFSTLMAVTAEEGQ